MMSNTKLSAWNEDGGIIIRHDDDVDDDVGDDVGDDDGIEGG